MCSSFVYIVASGQNGQIFIATTDDLVHQVWRHRTGAFEDVDALEDTGAPAACTKLVWHAVFNTPKEATAQLERLARWPQAWINRLVEEDNPNWNDLWAGLDDQPTIGISPAFSKHGVAANSHTPIIRAMRSVA